VTGDFRSVLEDWVVGDNIEKLSNRRKHKRLAIVTLRYHVVSGWEKGKASRVVLGVVDNISEDGLCLKTQSLEVDGIHLAYDDTPLVRNRLKIDLDLPGLSQSIQIEGDVEWYEKEPGSEFYTVGISFSKINERDREMLREYIEKMEQFHFL
jgi:hypothetical protein